MIDKELLECTIQVNGFTIEDICKVLGISRSSLYRKCNRKTEFTLSEIQKLVEVLRLNTNLTYAIFINPERMDDDE